MSLLSLTGRHLSQEKALEGNKRMNTAAAYKCLLKDKGAVIFGAGGAVGTAVAKEFAAHGATVFLSGRAHNDVEQVVNEITKDGGVAYAAGVDALDEQAVDAYLDRVAQEAGGGVIFFETIGPQAKEYGDRNNIVKLSP